MSSRWIGFFIWALVAACTAFWGIRIFAATRPVPSGAQAVGAAVPSAGPMDRLFGVAAAPTVAAQHPESERFQLVGVIAPPEAGDAGGLAIVTIDGQPARAWHVGASLDGHVNLLAVTKRSADFGPAGGPSSFTLQLPQPSAAETGTLAPAVSQPLISGDTADHVAQPGLPGMAVAPGTQGLPPRVQNAIANNALNGGALSGSAGGGFSGRMQNTRLGAPGNPPPANLAQPQGRQSGAGQDDGAAVVNNNQ